MYAPSVILLHVDPDFRGLLFVLRGFTTRIADPILCTVGSLECRLEVVVTANI